MSLGGLVDLFRWPAAAPVLLLVPLAWVFAGRLDRARERRLARALGPRVHGLAADLSPGQRRARRALAATGLALALVAVLQPAWGAGTTEPRTSDILVCLDVSRSMLARDVAPSRLAAAKREIRELAEAARGDRLGLVVFAGEARLSVPLTTDLDSFAELVELAEPEAVRRGGTDLGAALERALAALSEDGGGAAVLLLTDGEDHEQSGLSVARTCRERGITVHCIGYGSTLGSKVALEGPGGEVFLRDRSGQEVVSALDLATLRAIAETTGGRFVQAGARPRALVELYRDHVRPAARKSSAAEPLRERENRFQWPLLAALVLWMLELCLTDRKR